MCLSIFLICFSLGLDSRNLVILMLWVVLCVCRLLVIIVMIFVSWWVFWVIVSVVLVGMVLLSMSSLGWCGRLMMCVRIVLFDVGVRVIILLLSSICVWCFRMCLLLMIIM